MYRSIDGVNFSLYNTGADYPDIWSMTVFQGLNQEM